MHPHNILVPLILSGGSGTRLWPVSRETRPKQFIRLPDGQSLLQKTFARATALEGVEEILVVTNRNYFFETRDECLSPASEANVSFLLEPFGRNTAPAIAMGALRIAQAHGEDALLLVLPADHLIDDQGAFAAAVKHGCALAGKGRLVTFGIIPTAPETGYGYIECGSACNEYGGREVAGFTEKPPLAVAAEYIASGRYLWNSGMFCFKAGTILEQIKIHAPSIYEGALTCWEATRKRENAGQVIEIDAETFGRIPEKSIDYAVLEKSEIVAMVPASFGWSDIGSWKAISELVAPDQSGNRIVGEAVLMDVSNTYIQSEGRMVAAIGVDNLLVVDTYDALLIASRENSQQVGKIVQQLKLKDHESYKSHRTVSRPWGTYTILEEGGNFKIKRIVVKPGASLSLQLHHHRSEHWVVVSGTARVVNNGSTALIRTNESTYIPAGHKHRLENPGTDDLVIIEVQSGEYLGEDDIVRFDDVYGRT